jgi:hypothetical protein
MTGFGHSTFGIANILDTQFNETIIVRRLSTAQGSDSGPAVDLVYLSKPFQLHHDRPA